MFDVNGEFNWAWVLQPLILFVVSLVCIFIRHLLGEIRGLRGEIKDEAKRFEEYVRKEQCNLHMQVIEQHIKESEARISRMLESCKHRNGDGIG